MTFSDLGLNPKLAKGLRAMGYRNPREVQARAIPPILEGCHILGLAPTGTGKTAAFAAGMAHRLLESAPPRGRRAGERLRALVLTPTRELAQQVARETSRIVQGTRLRVVCVYGKVGMKAQVEQMKAGADILVGTPGRVIELLRGGVVSFAHVEYVTIDEADRMVDMGFRPQVETIMRAIPAAPQTLCFTATMPPSVRELVERHLRDPVVVEIGRHTTAADHVRQHLVEVADRDKVPLLLALLTEARARGVLIFCRTKRRVGWVATALERNGCAVSAIHGDRSQTQRERALKRFSSGELSVIVATDVAARGLHIPIVRTVVNYDLPIMPEEYVHRIGRAGHGGGFGESFTLLSKPDRQRWERIVETVDVTLESECIDGFEPTAGPGRREERRRDGDDRGDEAARGSRRRGRRIRSRAGKPIAKDQKPGRGVIRRQSS